jgi:uncharacterized protein (UPF0333 family)
MQLLIVVIVLATVGVGAYFWGADTRDGRDWQPLDVGGCSPSGCR